jgi:hypothetical protein
LSQPAIANMPPINGPLQAVSMECVASHETSEYFMPGAPMEIPPDIVMVPNICGITLAWRSAVSARLDRSRRSILQGLWC